MVEPPRTPPSAAPDRAASSPGRRRTPLAIEPLEARVLLNGSPPSVRPRATPAVYEAARPLVATDSGDLDRDTPSASPLRANSADHPGADRAVSLPAPSWKILSATLHDQASRKAESASPAESPDPLTAPDPAASPADETSDQAVQAPFVGPQTAPVPAAETPQVLEADGIASLLAATGATVQTLRDWSRGPVLELMKPGQKALIVDVPVDDAPSRLQVDLDAIKTGSEARFILYDDHGSILGQGPMPGPGTGLSLILEAQPGAPPRGDVFLGIIRSADEAAPGANAPPTTGENSDSPGWSPISFLLSISSATDSSGDALRPQAATASRGGSDSGGPAPVPWSMAPSLTGAANPPGLDPDPSDADYLATGPGQDALVPLPLRSAGPSPGALPEDGAEAPQVGPLDGKIVDLSLVDLIPEYEATADVQEAAPFAALASPGGFPLLAAGPTSDSAPGEPGPLLASEPRPDGAEESPPGEPERIETRRPHVILGIGGVATAALMALLPEILLNVSPKAPKRPLPWSGRRPGRRGREPFGPDGLG